MFDFRDGASLVGPSTAPPDVKAALEKHLLINFTRAKSGSIPDEQIAAVARLEFGVSCFNTMRQAALKFTGDNVRNIAGSTRRSDSQMIGSCRVRLMSTVS